MSREAMKLALEALVFAQYEDEEYDDACDQKVREARDALRQALQTEQEPFEYWNAVEGWVKIDEVREHFDAVGCGTIYKSAGEGRSPLYTAPQKKEWVGLTNEEIDILSCEMVKGDKSVNWLCKVLEAKLKEKNNA